MDAHLDSLSRENLIAEIKRLRNGIRDTATVTGMTCAGIIPSYGDDRLKEWSRK